MMRPADILAKVRWIGSPGGGCDAGFIRWGDLVLRDVRPVKCGGGGHVINKAGRLVLRAESDQGPIKLYQAANPRHAQFLHHVSGCGALASSFPRVLAVSGNIVMTEWVQGTTLGTHKAEEAIAGIAAIRRALHGFDATTGPEACFDYWFDFIRPRFVTACDILGQKAVLATVCDSVDAAWRRSRLTLHHPDLSPSNIVRNARGELKVIDNELLSLGGMALSDVCNAAKSLSRKTARRCLELCAGESFISKDDRLHELRCFWLAREVGSSIASGSCASALDVIGRFMRDEGILPWDAR